MSRKPFVFQAEQVGISATRRLRQRSIAENAQHPGKNEQKHDGPPEPLPPPLSMKMLQILLDLNITDLLYLRRRHPSYSLSAV